MAEVADSAVPVLPRGVRLRRCELREASFLLAPERAVRLQDSAAAILGAVDGERDVAAIIRGLARTFNAPEGEIAADVRAFLADLAARRMLEWRQ